MIDNRQVPGPRPQRHPGPDPRRGRGSKLRLPARVFAVVLLAALSSALAGPLRAEPSIEWTPGSVVEELLPGNSRLVSLSFTPNQDLPQGTLRPVPALAPFLQISRGSFQNLVQGQATTIEILLSVPPDAEPATFKGTLQLRDGVGPGAKNLAKPLQITLIILEPGPGGGLPPDPGEEGRATLEGIDSDGDGIRDDIQRFIALTHPDSEKLRAGLTQFTRVVQEALLVRDDKPLSLNASSRSDRAIECLYFLLSSGAADVINELHAEILNTVERSRAYLTYDAQLFGGIFPSASQFKLSCAFDPDALPN